MNLTEIVLGLMVLLGVAVPAILVYKRGIRDDTVVNETAAVVAETAATAQVYAGYGGLLQFYREDSTEQRRLRAAAEEAQQRCQERVAELLEILHHE